jgi:anthranilate synthase component 2
MHGKTSLVHHDGSGLFSSLSNPFQATRYHSLVIDQDSNPDCLEVTAWTLSEDGAMDEIMAVRHRSLPVEGVQFHPESILTEHGHDLLRNFLGLKPETH